MDKLMSKLYREVTGTDWVDGESDPIPALESGKPGGAKVNMDGAKYHLRILNKSPTKSSKRPFMIEWLKANHPDKITVADEMPAPRGRPTGAAAAAGGLTREQLWEIIKPVKPPPDYAVYGIAAKYGHELCITPSYKARSAPVEIIWANTKNPVARMQTKNMNELKLQVLQTMRNKITEKTWLGAYRTTRQWEDAQWALHGCDVRDEGAESASSAASVPDHMDADEEDEELEDEECTE
jgi:hypothetical protein